MNENITIKVTDVIGSQLCISAEDGQKVFEKTSTLLKNGNHVTLSFEHVTTLISLFLNASIGQLYGTFNEDQIREHLHVSGLADDDLEMLKRVVDNAKRYYSNPKVYDDAWNKEDGDEE